MRIFSRKTLREFWEAGHADAKTPLEAWYYETKKADWNSPQEVKNQYPSASVISNDRIVFNIKGNAYRLVCAIDYQRKGVFIRFIGTHAEYDKINAKEI